MSGNKFSSSTSCSRWLHETEPGRLDPSLSGRFLKVATQPEMFEILKDELLQLNDSQLRELVARLCEAELRQKGFPASAVRWGGAQTAPDGGLDVDCRVEAGGFTGDFVPRGRTGFQVKKHAMPAARIKDEMSPKGALRPIFPALASENGCYAIVSLADDITPEGPMLLRRLSVMEAQIEAIEDQSSIELRFYGRGDLANWLRQHPGVQLWVREVLWVIGKLRGLRLSTFVIDTIDPANRKFWESLIGTSPDEVHSRPRQPSVKEEGPFLNGWLSVEASNNRIDWRLSHDPKNPPQELPAVGPYDVLRGEFQELMKRWLTLCPPIHRLAYGAVLLLPIRSLPDAHTMLDNLLPAVKIDRDNTRDLLYRINMRRASFCSIEGLEINRLSTWSVVRISEMLIGIPPRWAAITEVHPVNKK